MTASPYFLVLRSSRTWSRMKFEGRGSELEEDEFAVLMLFIFYMEERIGGWRRFSVEGRAGAPGSPPLVRNPRDNLRREGLRPSGHHR